MRTAVITLLAAVAVSPAVAQWDCGGTQYTVGSLHFSEECSQTVQSCVDQFEADASEGNCQNDAGDLFMQQQPSGGNNSHVATAFNDILDHCLLNGSTTGTWYNDGQWYWIAAESACYNFSMPGIPRDLTTPVQQRLTVHSANGKFQSSLYFEIGFLDRGIDGLHKRHPRWTLLTHLSFQPQLFLLAGTLTRKSASLAFNMGFFQSCCSGGNARTPPSHILPHAPIQTL